MQICKKIFKCFRTFFAKKCEKYKNINVHKFFKSKSYFNMKQYNLSKTLQHWCKGEVDMNLIPPSRQNLRVYSFLCHPGGFCWN